MESYEVVVHKTVKDLYKSNSLSQILKYKQNKEKELTEKDEEMKKLILDKYPFLIDSLSNLEEIYSKIPNLEKLRKSFITYADELRNIDDDEKLFLMEYTDASQINDIFDSVPIADKLCDFKSNSADMSTVLNSKVNGSEWKEEILLEKIEDEIFSCWDLIKRKDYMNVGDKILIIDRLSQIFISKKVESLSDISDYPEEYFSLFIQEIMNTARLTFINEFELINREYFNLIVQKIISDLTSNLSEPLENKFYKYLKFIFTSIMINNNIEYVYCLKDYNKDINQNSRNLLNSINKFLSKSEIFNTILFALKNKKDILNTKDFNLNEIGSNKYDFKQEQINSNEDMVHNPFVDFLNEQIFDYKLLNAPEVNVNPITTFTTMENKNIFSYEIDNANKMVKNKLFNINFQNNTNFKNIIDSFTLMKSLEIIFSSYSFKVQKFYGKINEYIFDNIESCDISNNKQRKNCNLSLNEIQVFEENYIEYITNVFYIIYCLRLLNSNIFNDKFTRKNNNSRNLENMNLSSNCYDSNEISITLNEKIICDLINKFSEVIKCSCDLRFDLERKYNFSLDFHSRINAVITTNQLKIFFQDENFDKKFFDLYILDTIVNFIDNDIKHEFSLLKQEKCIVFDNCIKSQTQTFLQEDEDFSNNIHKLDFLKNFIINFCKEYISRNPEMNDDEYKSKFVDKLYHSLQGIILDHLNFIINETIESQANLGPKSQKNNLNTTASFRLNKKNFYVFLDKNVFRALQALKYEDVIDRTEKLSMLYISLKLNFFQLYLEKSSNFILYENFVQEEVVSTNFSNGISFTIINFLKYLKDSYSFDEVIVPFHRKVSNDFGIYFSNEENNLKVYIKQNLKLCILRKLINYYKNNIIRINYLLSEKGNLINKKHENVQHGWELKIKIKQDYFMLKKVEEIGIARLISFKSKFSNTILDIIDSELNAYDSIYADSTYIQKLDEEFSKINFDNSNGSSQNIINEEYEYGNNNDLNLLSEYFILDLEDDRKENKSQENHIHYLSNHHKFLSISKTKFELLSDIKKEMLVKISKDKPYNKRISNYLIAKNIPNGNIEDMSDKSQKDFIPNKFSSRLNTKPKNLYSSSNFNSSKLFEIRIDENYISLKMTNVNNEKSQSLHSINNTSNLHQNLNLNITNNLTDKVNEIQRITTFDQKGTKINENTHINNSSTNTNFLININSNNASLKDNQNLKSQDTQQTAKGYFGYLNYFSGKIKENLSNLTTGLGINQVVDQKDANLGISNNPKK